jgi:hypothetical protein
MSKKIIVTTKPVAKPVAGMPGNVGPSDRRKLRALVEREDATLLLSLAWAALDAALADATDVAKNGHCSIDNIYVAHQCTRRLLALGNVNGSA